MARLVDAYRAARGGASEPDRQQSHDAGVLESTLSELARRGRVGHPEISLADEAFAAHLGRCGADVGGRADELHVADLYLCGAALLGDDTAVRILRARHRDVVKGYVRAVDPTSAFVQEIEQQFWAAALVGSAEASPKLASYAGRGPLAMWLGVGAQRLALSTMRHESAERRSAVGAAAEARLITNDPEISFIKGSLREVFQRAVAQAFVVLDDRQRMVYRLHLVDGLTVERIGHLYGVVRSTVTRWLADARAAIVADVKRQLRDEISLPPEDFESLARLLASDLDLSISRILASPR